MEAAAAARNRRQIRVLLESHHTTAGRMLWKQRWRSNPSASDTRNDEESTMIRLAATCKSYWDVSRPAKKI